MGSLNRNTSIYSRGLKISAVLMILSLLWLTISLPYVDTARKNIAAASAEANTGQQDEGNPFSNTTEEKTPGNNASEEYLHHAQDLAHPGALPVLHHCNHYARIYIAFHGELTVPPPEI